GQLMPLSCCILKDDGQPKNSTLCQMATDNYYWKEGCRDQIEDWIDDHSRILIGVGCGIAALEIIGLICAICFCRHMDREKYSSN
ncbi:tetraspanin, partial [Elysia marginata]